MPSTLPSVFMTTGNTVRSSLCEELFYDALCVNESAISYNVLILPN
jgi:hypothetical protein